MGRQSVEEALQKGLKITQYMFDSNDRKPDGTWTDDEKYRLIDKLLTLLSQRTHWSDPEKATIERLNKYGDDTEKSVFIGYRKYMRTNCEALEKVLEYSINCLREEKPRIEEAVFGLAKVLDKLVFLRQADA